MSNEQLRFTKHIEKQHFTTGETARICDASISSVIKWCNEGMLRFTKVPGSRHRRIAREDLKKFIEQYRLPPQRLKMLDAQDVAATDAQPDGAARKV